MRPSLLLRDRSGLKSVVFFCIGMTIFGAPMAQPSPTESWGVGLPLVHHSRDSDGLSITKAGAGIYPWLAHAQDWQGLELYRFHYAQAQTTLHANAVLYSQENRSPQTGLGYTLRAGVREDRTQKDWILDANRSWPLGEASRVELFAQRDRVESISALLAGTTMNLVGVAVDYSLHPRVTAVALASKTWFSDSAQRDLQRLRLIGDLIPDSGLTLQWSLRRQSGTPAQGPRLYFNPEDMTESLLVLGVRRRVAGWQLQGRIGFGTQEVSGDRSPARHFDLTVVSPLENRQTTRLRVVVAETFGLSGPGYRYQSIDIHTVWQF
jgi:hypothetical protein